MIRVSIMEKGDVEYVCERCSLRTVVEMHDTESVFWDMHNGLAILSMLGHFNAIHRT